MGIEMDEETNMWVLMLVWFFTSSGLFYYAVYYQNLGDWPTVIFGSGLLFAFAYHVREALVKSEKKKMRNSCD